jgi:hypothetical protein
MRKVLFLLLLVPNLVSASLFGPSNYEECMTQGKTGRTDAELALKHKECRKKFPKLPSIKFKKDKFVSCTYSQQRTTHFNISVDSKAISGKFNDSLIAVSVFTDQYVLFNWSSNMLKIDYISGGFELTDTKGNSFFGNCVEHN